MKRLLCSLLITGCAFAQDPLTLRSAVEQAAAKYPSIAVSLEQVKAAAEGVNLARTAFLPKAEFAAQVNRATHNNVFGILLPGTGFPSLSGPVLRTNSFDTVWGSAVGVNVSWEPFDFGLRQAAVNAAGATKDRATAEVAVTRFNVSAATADAFLTLQAALEVEKAANAAVERAKQLDTIVSALAKSELRPGADASRSRAELAAAKTQAIQARQAIANAKAVLAQMTGAPVTAIAAEQFLETPKAAAPATENPHPVLTAQQAAIAETKAREEILKKSFMPKFNLEGSAYARGTGIQPDGHDGGFLSGLGPNYQNWALGFNVTFAPTDIFQLRVKRNLEATHEASDRARYRLLVTELDAQTAKAKAALDAAREIAENTPVQVEAARAGEAQARARYQAGLSNITDLADAQRILTQAEIDNALARLNIWRAMLQLATAQGDLASFLQAAEAK